MIKNILYSLSLHSLVSLLIYFNFYSLFNEKIDLKDGISVSIGNISDIAKPKNKNEEISQIKTESKSKNLEIKKTVNKTQNQRKELKNKSKVIKKKSIKPLLEKETKTTSVAKEEKEEEIINNIEEKKEDVEESKINEENLEPQEELKSAEINSNNDQLVQDLENLQLSAREKFNIQSQLHACYKRAKSNFPESDISVTVGVRVLKDGTIDFDSEKIIDIKKYNDPKEIDYKNKMDSVIQTLELCSPIRNLPLDKYNIWQEFIIEF